MVLVAGMVIVLGDEVFRLLDAPLAVVSLVEHARTNRKRGHADARQAEVVGAVIVSGIGIGIGNDRQSERLGRALDRGIEGGALGAGNADFLRNSQGRYVVKIQVERNLLGGQRRI